MEFVDDYKAKKKLAEKLRARADRLNSMGADDFTYGATTAARGAFPGMTQANLSAPIAQLGTAIMGKISESRAANAEEEANNARMSAMNAILGGTAGATGAGGSAAQPGAMGAGAGTMTPDKLLALQDMGIDSSVLKMLAPKQQSMGAITQAARDPAAREALVGMGVITREQADAMAAAQQAAEQQEMQMKRDQYTWEQNNKRFAPTQGRAPSDYELWKADKEGFEAFQAAKGLAKGKGGSSGMSPYEKKLAEEQAKVDVKLLEGEGKIAAGIKRADDLIAQYTKTPYTKGAQYRALDAASDMIKPGSKASNFDPEVQIQEQAAKQFHLDAMEQMRGFGQVTEAEQAIIEATQFDRYDSPQVRLQKLNTIKAALQRGMEKVKAAKERARRGTPVLDQAPEAPADGGGQWSVKRIK